MATNFYWFDPNTSRFYGPSTVSHAEIINSDNNLFQIIDKFLDEGINSNIHTLHDILEQRDWVRLCFNQNNNELSISCSKNKNALKTIRNFIKQESFEIKSLFLDINDIHIQSGVIGEDIDQYIKTGRIHLNQNS